MRKNLYHDLYELEDSHWWHRAKRSVVVYYISQFTKTSQKILDMGCGTGKNLETFRTFGKIYGVDSSYEAITFCKKRGIDTVYKEDITSTNFKKNSFDIITALDVLEHVDDQKALNEIGRIIKVGGILIITVPAFAALWSEWDVVLHHKRRYTTEQLRQLLTMHNFSIIKLSYMYSFLVIPVYITRYIKSKVSHDDYTSDFRINNKVVNLFFLFLTKVEQLYMKNFFIPFGTSILCVCTKK